MDFDDKLKKLKETFTETLSYSLTDLINLGFDVYEIKALEYSEKLKLKNGIYYYNNLDDILELELSFFNSSDYVSSIKILKNCRKLGFDRDKINSLLFLRLIQIGNFAQALRVLKSGLRNNPNYRIYIFLLSNIISINKETNRELKYDGRSFYIFKLNNVNDDYEMSLVKLYNQLFDRNFQEALNTLNYIVLKFNKDSLDNEIMATLLNDAKDLQEDNIKSAILKYAKEKDYARIINYYKENNVNFTFEDYIIKVLTEQIIRIKVEDVLPEVIINETNNIYDAINGNNYQLALELFMLDGDENNPIFYLLNELCYLTSDNLKLTLNKEE